MAAATIPWKIVDADNHWYEAEDAWIRYQDKGDGPPIARLVTEANGHRRLIVGDRLFRSSSIMFDPIARPGSTEQNFRKGNPAKKDLREAFGVLERLSDHPEYRDRDARLAVMDRQNVEAAILLPTMGVSVEWLLGDNPGVPRAIHAFNRWVDDDWGFTYKDRIFGAALISLLDVDAAVKELDWALMRGARYVHLQRGPVKEGRNGRSPADRKFDPFWNRINDAGIPVVFHAAGSDYAERYGPDWGHIETNMPMGHATPFQNLMFGDRPTVDTTLAIFHDRLFERFPNVRIAYIELGSEWVDYTLRRLEKAADHHPAFFKDRPTDTFKEHCYVSPFYEEDIRELADLIGVNRIIFGSDWPHAEGLYEPMDFLKDIESFSDADKKTIMRDAALELLTPRPLSRA